MPQGVLCSLKLAIFQILTKHLRASSPPYSFCILGSLLVGGGGGGGGDGGKGGYQAICTLRKEYARCEMLSVSLGILVCLPVRYLVSSSSCDPLGGQASGHLSVTALVTLHCIYSDLLRCPSP